MYCVYIVMGEKEQQILHCKRVYLRTDLNILNVLTKFNEYKTIDLNYVTYFDISKMKEEKDDIS